MIVRAKEEQFMCMMALCTWQTSCSVAVARDMNYLASRLATAKVDRQLRDSCSLVEMPAKPHR